MKEFSLLMLLLWLPACGAPGPGENVPLQTTVVPLDVASVEKRVDIRGSFMHCDLLSTGAATYKLDTTSDAGKYLGAGMTLRGEPFDAVFLTHGAQPGRVLVLLWGDNSDVTPAVSYNPLGQPARADKISTYNLGGASGETPINFTAGSTVIAVNTNGIIIHNAIIKLSLNPGEGVTFRTTGYGIIAGQWTTTGTDHVAEVTGPIYIPPDGSALTIDVSFATPAVRNGFAKIAYTAL